MRIEREQREAHRRRSAPALAADGERRPPPQKARRASAQRPRSVSKETSVEREVPPAEEEARVFAKLAELSSGSEGKDEGEDDPSCSSASTAWPSNSIVARARPVAVNWSRFCFR